MILGASASARAMATRCCWPPDSCDGYRRACASSPTLASCAIAFASASARPRRRTVRSASATLPSAVIWGQRLNCWNTMPMVERSARVRPAGSRTGRPSGPGAKPSGSPPTSTTPALGASSSAMQRSSVLLPEPEGPIRHVTWPWGTSRSMPRSTSASPKRLTRALTARAGGLMRRRIATGAPRRCARASRSPRRGPSRTGPGGTAIPRRRSSPTRWR